MTPAPRSVLVLAIMLATAILVVQARVLLGGRTWDDTAYHVTVAPPRLAAARAVQAGELPAWWDGTALGVPLLGEPSHGAAYPPMWLAATPRALDLVMLAHVLWVALGVAMWAGRRGAGLGALIAGVITASLGIVTSAALRGALPGLAHLPWIAWAATGLAAATHRTDRARAAAALGVLIGAVALAGELALVIDGVALALVIAARPGTWRALAVAIACGLAIGAVQWLPAAYVIASSAGGHVAGLPLKRLVELIVPVPASTAAWPSLYMGAPLVALAALGRPGRGLGGLVAGLAVAALVVGRAGWPAWLGAPEPHLAALALIAAGLAATGLEALIAGARRARQAIGFATAVSAVGLVATAAARSEITDTLIDGGLGLACMIAVLVIARRMPGRHGAIVATLIVAPGVAAMRSSSPVTDRAAVAAEPAWARAGLAIASEPRRFYRAERLGPEDRSVEDAIATLAGASADRFGLAAARSDDPAQPSASDAAWRAAGHDGTALLDRYGIALAVLPASRVGAGNPAELARRGSWALVKLKAAPAAAVFVAWQWLPDPATAVERLYPVAGGGLAGRDRVVLAGTGPDNEDEQAPPAPCAIERWSAGAIDLSCTAQVDGTAPPSGGAAGRGKAPTVDDTAPPSGGAAGRGKAPTVDDTAPPSGGAAGRGKAPTVDDTAPPSGGAAGRGKAPTVDDTAPPSGGAAGRGKAPTVDGYAVVSSSTAPGWSVAIDGRDTPWVTADVVRRAVALPPGSHRVSWRYALPGLLPALVLAGLGLAGLAVIRWRRPGRGSRATT